MIAKNKYLRTVPDKIKNNPTIKLYGIQALMFNSFITNFYIF